MPSDRDLAALRRMDAMDGEAVVRRILALWDHDYGRAVWRGSYLRLASGGWSENEAIVSHLPQLFCALYWWRSERGGLHVYKVTKLKGEVRDGK